MDKELLGSLELNRIYQMDCLEGMKLIPDKSIDMILCDPPYGNKKTACKWDMLLPENELWEQYERIIKDNGAIVLTSSQPFTTKLISSNMSLFKYCWVWEKTRPGDIFNAKNKPLKSHEDICIFSKGTTANGSKRKMHYYPQGVGKGGIKTNNPDDKEYAFKGKRPSHKKNHITEGSHYPRSVIKIANPNKNSYHPTQKPVELFEYLIKTYTNENETVLDNCIGSGTTAIAAINTGRRYIGFETEKKYYDIANERIANTYKELNSVHN